MTLAPESGAAQDINTSKAIDTLLADQASQLDEIRNRLANLEANEGPAAVTLSIALIEDNKASGTAGGTFTSGADRTRDLNTEVSDIDGIVSIASNQFTLAQAGTYLIEWFAPAFVVGTHQSFLYSVTAASELKRGAQNSSNTVSGIEPTQSGGFHVVVQSGSVTYEIRHRNTTTRVTDGFGPAASKGTEVYTQVIIIKYA